MTEIENNSSSLVSSIDDSRIIIFGWGGQGPKTVPRCGGQVQRCNLKCLLSLRLLAPGVYLLVNIGYYNIITNKSQEKRAKKLATEHSEGTERKKFIR